jgi:hypothetical protein
MIRTLIIISASGLVLFQKSFVNAVSQPRLIGSLLTAMIEFSSKVAGIPLAYIELLGCGVSVVTNDVAKVNCALFYDLEDGPEFGKLIATEILLAFSDAYSADLGGIARDLNQFQDFQYTISSVIRNSVRPVLLALHSERGIQAAVLVTDQATYTIKEIDQIGVQANLHALVGAATDVLTAGDLEDAPTQIFIDTGEAKTRLVVWKLQGVGATYLVVRVSKVAKMQEKVRVAIDKALTMLRKVCALSLSLHASSLS